MTSEKCPLEQAQKLVSKLEIFIADANEIQVKKRAEGLPPCGITQRFQELYSCKLSEARKVIANYQKTSQIQYLG